MFQQEFQYLGYIISETGAATNPENVEAVRQRSRPKCIQKVRLFLGFVRYYRRFFPDFVTIARPLNVLTNKETESHWGDPEEEALLKLKHLMTEAPILTPNPAKT